MFVLLSYMRLSSLSWVRAISQTAMVAFGACCGVVPRSIRDV